MQASLQVPAWLSLSEDAASVALSRPSLCNGVEVQQLTLRAPTVRDVRQASRLSSDDEERELQLFASLAQISRQDLEGLKLSDYQRLQQAYFRLVHDDGADAGADATAGTASGS